MSTFTTPKNQNQNKNQNKAKLPAAPKKPAAPSALFKKSQPAVARVRATTPAPVSTSAVSTRAPVARVLSLGEDTHSVFHSHGEVIHNGLHVGGGVRAGFMEKSTRTKGGSRVTRLTGTERLFNVDDGTYTAGTLRASRALHPCFLGPRIGAEAQLFAKYRFNRARIRFVPNVTCQSNASLQTLYLGVVCDPDRAIPNGVQLLDEMTEWKIGKDGNVDIFNVTSYAAVNAVFPDDNSKQDFFIETRGDERFTVQAKVIAVAGSVGVATNATLGTVFVDYDIELYDLSDTALLPPTVYAGGLAVTSGSTDLGLLSGWCGAADIAQLSATKTGAANLILNPIPAISLSPGSSPTSAGWMINMHCVANTVAAAFLTQARIDNLTQASIVLTSPQPPGVLLGNGGFGGMWAAHSVGNALDLVTTNSSRQTLATNFKLLQTFVVANSATIADPLAPTVCSVTFPTVSSGTMSVFFSITVLATAITGRATPNNALPCVSESKALMWMGDHPEIFDIDADTRSVLAAFCAAPPFGEEEYAQAINDCFRLGVAVRSPSTAAMHPALPILLWFVQKFGTAIAAKMLSVAQATLERWIKDGEKKDRK